jgi:hypothetical protein
MGNGRHASRAVDRYSVPRLWRGPNRRLQPAKADQALDVAVDAAFRQRGQRGWRSDAELEAFLFERYRAITSSLPAPKPPARKRRAAGSGQTAP